MRMKTTQRPQIVTSIAASLKTVLTKRANELAHETGFIKRQRKMTGSGFALGLIFGWLADADSRLETLVQSCCNVSVEITRQGLHNRFTPEAATFLKMLLYETISQVIRGNPVNTDILSKFSGVYILDSTTIKIPDKLKDTWKGCQGNALKISVLWDLLTGQLIDIELHHAKENDQRAVMQTMKIPENVIRIADLGYYKLDVLDQIGNNGGLWVSRHQIGTKIFDRTGNPIDLVERLEQCSDDEVDILILLGAEKKLKCRLIAQRIPVSKLEQRRKRVKQRDSKRQKKSSEQKESLLGWSIYITNASAEQLTGAEVAIMIRVRWQIELLFKLWKGHMKIDEWKTENEWRILCEIYAKLIACIIQHWLMIAGGIHALDKSMVRAIEPIRHLVWGLAFSLANRLSMVDCLIEQIANILAQTCPLDSSSTSLTTYQRIKALVP